MANDFNSNGAKITITNVSKSTTFGYDDKGIIVPADVSYNNTTIQPGESISFTTCDVNEILCDG